MRPTRMKRLYALLCAIALLTSCPEANAYAGTTNTRKAMARIFAFPGAAQKPDASPPIDWTAGPWHTSPVDFDMPMPDNSHSFGTQIWRHAPDKRLAQLLKVAE